MSKYQEKIQLPPKLSSARKITLGSLTSPIFGQERLQTLKPCEKSSFQINSHILEIWLDHCLQGAEELELPNFLKIPEYKQPLKVYSIDRLRLKTQGLTQTQIDRLYHGLFTYSLGFYQLLLEVMQNIPNRNILLTHIWKVYAILLEYCCHMDYQLIIQQVQLDLQHKIDEQSRYLQKFTEKVEANEKNLQECIKNMRFQLQDISKELQHTMLVRDQLQDELNDKGNGYSQEVALRIKYEQQLNYMLANSQSLFGHIQNLERGISSQKDELDKSVKKLKQVTSKLCIENSEKLQLMNSNQKYINEIQECKLQLKSKQREVDQITTIQLNQYDQLDSLRKEVRKLTISNDEKIMSIQILENDINRLREDLRQSHDLQMGYKRENRELNQKIGKIRNKNLRLIEQNAQISVQQSYNLDKIENLDAGYKKYKQLIGKIQQKYSKSESNYRNTQMILNTVKEDLQKVTQQNGIYIDKIEYQAKKRQQLKSLIELLQKQLHEQKIEIKELKIRIQEKVDELKYQMQNNELLQKNADQESDKRTREQSKYNDIIANQRQKLQGLQEAVAKESELRKQWMSKHETVKKQLYERESENRQLNQQANNSQYLQKEAFNKLEIKQNELKLLETKYWDVIKQVETLTSISDERLRFAGAQQLIVEQYESQIREVDYQVEQQIMQMKDIFKEKLNNKDMIIQEILQGIAQVEEQKRELSELVQMESQETIKWIEQKDYVDKLNYDKIEQIKKLKTLLDDKMHLIEQLQQQIIQQNQQINDLNDNLSQSNQKYSQLYNQIPIFYKEVEYPIKEMEVTIKKQESFITSITSLHKKTSVLTQTNIETNSTSSQTEQKLETINSPVFDWYPTVDTNAETQIQTSRTNQKEEVQFNALTDRKIVTSFEKNRVTRRIVNRQQTTDNSYSQPEVSCRNQSMSNTSYNKKRNIRVNSSPRGQGFDSLLHLSSFSIENEQTYIRISNKAQLPLLQLPKNPPDIKDSIRSAISRTYRLNNY